MPGVDVQGLRVPGSVIDSLAPATNGDRFERGSGTSQAAAIVAGLAAQLISRYPTASAGEIEVMLQRAALPISGGRSAWSQGAGAVVASRLLAVTPTTRATTLLATTGTAPIGSDRIDQTVALDGVGLTREVDVQGKPWPGATWAAAASKTTSWNGGLWMGRVYTGNGFTSSGWAIALWPSTWSGKQFSASGGPGGAWDGVRWNGVRWNGTTWSGVRWAGVRWNGSGWEGVRWNGLRWNATTWS